MATIQWRPEPNPLTVPYSWKIRFVPRDSSGTDELAVAMNEENPNYSVEDAKTMLALLKRVIQKKLLNGEQATIDGMITFGFSFTGRLDTPDDPLPPVDETLHVDVRVLAPFFKEIRQQARFEKLPMTEKGPVIDSVEDTRLHLADVLNSKGVLKLTGTNLLFDPEVEGNGCVIEGTRSWQAAQTQFGPLADSSIVIVPDIPAQDAPFNNEYTLSVSARPSGHGSPRTGTYRRRLRSPLAVTKLGHPNPPEVGILTGKAANPLASVTGGTVSADEMLRIQAVFDIRNSVLLLSLLGMKENGPAGAAVTVAANGAYTVPGFSGSAVGQQPERPGQ
ncbi:MAG: hypothetical protein CDV28_10320 [Candidatus Electronema aureum]|uniref:Uncharacterized protein n=1 Tax=Candidatus Electronema aureum TaxID=2005002 RepID=A0A521G4H3_9BACT|nr:MAG: hypothetical protein CDV28_10320 [Candidatus Electronema aureum]